MAAPAGKGSRPGGDVCLEICNGQGHALVQGQVLDACLVQFEELSVSVTQRHNVREGGAAGQAMVFAHGLGCDQNMWRFVAPAFEGTHRVILFGHVGSGGSDLSAYDPT